jgi:hypothetical protein
MMRQEQHDANKDVRTTLNLSQIMAEVDRQQISVLQTKIQSNIMRHKVNYQI